MLLQLWNSQTELKQNEEILEKLLSSKFFRRRFLTTHSKSFIIALSKLMGRYDS